MNRLNEYEIDFGHHGRTTIIDIAGPRGAPAVMLLHGLGATARLNWAPSLAPLAQHFRVLSLDHRGHGRGLRTHRFELEQCAADAAAAARARRVHRLVAVGYSMGGPIASLLWHKHRGLVDGLVLCATAHDLVPARIARAARLLLPTAAALASWMPGRAHDFMFGDLLRRVEPPELREHLEQEVSRHDPASVIQALHQLATFSSHAWLRTIDVPTAVLVMTQDRLVPPDRQYALAAAIPGAQVYEVAGNHLSCVGQPELFVPTLIRACRDVQWRARRPPDS